MDEAIPLVLDDSLKIGEGAKRKATDAKWS
jgi:hypothetical protein